MWEEHVFYFTKNSFINLLRASGLKVEYFGDRATHMKIF